MATGHNSSTLGPGARNAYWQVVEDCLVKFHNRTPQKAIMESVTLRRQVESPSPGIDGDLIYHDEPFYVACDLAGLHDISEQEHLLKNNRVVYKAILASNNW